MNDLDLREFFDAYDRGDPYHLSAVGELHSEIRRVAPELLAKDAEWYRTWTWGGKRDLLTGLLERNGKVISPS